ncbi:hypothetical protein F751_2536 [Auxenochlorella protothecoides]|uniref:Chloride conductance regulatory protein ICln n=1 Tax=Auxenochlorella protothecoides TaxID=3075 RepID=A0A087SIZ0_AUXPR|nr:hypothetical protein F751_2536 [Auxenochlorella protothecoides]KFM25694.1 hypothetical protein F751_2536 [Auxenochlorella protothecoides]RMZ57366.1 hypothetical protein APUTEX25_004200 [Auxenochlorella protothecoides]|eukprot:RMZ57366.1 hypothetical protein APUTEX25_004200 [Auxenochlorella protothecoides]
MTPAQCGNGHAHREAGGEEVPQDDDTVLQSFSGVVLKRSSSDAGWPGSLQCTKSALSWLPQEGGPPALALPFTEIAMHAVVSGTGDQAACLYLQLAGGDSDYEDEAEEEGEGASEVWLIPSDPALVEPLFAALSEGAERNPDDGEEGEDEEGGIFFDEEEVLAGTDAALHRLEIEEALGGDPNRFSDADEDEEGM